METEAELVAEGRAVDAIGFDDNYGMNPLPTRVLRWLERWRAHEELAVEVATDLHAGWEVRPSTGGMRNGRLVFAYLRGDPVRRECGGMFTVPYLATRDDLADLIREHRPNDYGGDYDPGATPHAGITWVPGHAEP